jgi:hypothetical protein
MRGRITSEMAPSGKHWPSRIYTRTRTGREQLETETEAGEPFALAVRRVLKTT